MALIKDFIPEGGDKGAIGSVFKDFIPAPKPVFVPVEPEVTEVKETVVKAKKEKVIKPVEL